jgi:hypothetical protein
LSSDATATSLLLRAVTVSHALVISLVLLFIDTWQLSPFICSGIMIVQDAINIIFLFFDGGGVYDIL